MKNIVRHGKYIHIRTCPKCDCEFTYFDNGERGDDVEYDWDYVGDHKWDNFKFIQKRLYCPECKQEIIIKAEDAEADYEITLLLKNNQMVK